MHRRAMLHCGIGGALGALALDARAAEACAADTSHTRLLDRYVASVNAHDTAPFAELFTEGYVQHSGRSPSGLPAQMTTFQRLFESMPDLAMRIEDRVISGDKVVARTTYSATHTQTIRGIPPTGKAFSFQTIDIWRVQDGKFAEHWDLTDAGEVLQKLRT
jgi:steroid delta-isomerase-like uncharacterized protein